MELRMLETKLLSFPKEAGFRTNYPSSLITAQISPISSASKVTCSTTSDSRGNSSTVLQLMKKINGINGAVDNNDRKILDYFDDEYGGVVVNPEKLPSDSQLFASLLHSSVCQWKIKGKKGIWLKLPLEYSEYVPIAVKEGFEYHHAERGYIMLTYWLPEGPCLLPANASHLVGIGAFVMNDKYEVLVVQERYCTPSTVGLWKIPTGFIVESEEIYTGSVREVKEETGVDAEFLEVIAFRHAQNMAFEKSDLFFICMLKPLSSEIKVDDHEIQAAKWMPLMEFVKQPLIKEDRMFMKVIDIFTERMRKKYCGLRPHHWSLNLMVDLPPCITMLSMLMILTVKASDYYHAN